MKTPIKSLLLILSFYFASAGISQDIYRTQNGSMIVSGISSDSAITLRTSDMLVILNYEDASIQIKVDKSTFYTGNDSLDKKLKKLKYDIISFTGKLDIDYINTKEHPPQDFNVEGIISSNKTDIIGTGQLQHIADGSRYSCFLTLKFILKLSDLGINICLAEHLNDDGYSEFRFGK